MAGIKIANSIRIALVDDADFEFLNRYKWWLSTHKRKSGRVYFYAFTEINGKTVTMGRLLLSAAPRQVVIPLDHDGLNCRRDNLKLVTYSQKNAHARKRVNTSSSFKGVSRRGNRYLIALNSGNENHYVGFFKSEKLAARAYDKKATELYGEFAQLNFPGGL